MEQLNQINMKPAFMLVAYSKKKDSFLPSNNESFYFESHEFFKGKATAGRPLKKQALKKLLGATFEEDKKENKSMFTFRGLIPPALLHFSGTTRDKLKLTWFIPSGFRKMFFSESLEIPNGTAYQPNIIFHLDGKTLSVFAITDDKVTVSSKLYLPPYFNISTQGYVCMGTAFIKNTKLKTIDDIMESYENAFFNSYFSHAGNLYTKVKFNMVAFWRTHIEKQTTSFPEEALTLTNFKVSDLIKNSN